jgi:hypothetical protein
MNDITPKLTIGDVIGYFIAYMCWICTAAAGMLAILQARNALNVLWPAAGGSHWVLRPIDRFGLVLMGLLWLVYVIFVEQHYRTGITVVRQRRHKARTDPGSVPALPPAQGWFMKMLRRLGLDILAMRFLPTLMLPLVLFVIAYLAQQLGFELIENI